jgi:predicted alpha/beta-fold hydrolase
VQTIVSSVGRKLFKPSWLDSFLAQSEHRDIHVMGQHLTAQYSRASQADAPVVIIIHGWLGSADSSYVLSSAQALHGQGFQVVRLTLRDHGNTAHLNEGLFHSAMTDEVVAAAQFIMEDFPDSRAGLMGFSMGGNFALRLAKHLPEAHHLGHLSRHQSRAHGGTNWRQPDLPKIFYGQMAGPVGAKAAGVSRKL